MAPCRTSAGDSTPGKHKATLLHVACPDIPQTLCQAHHILPHHTCPSTPPHLHHTNTHAQLTLVNLLHCRHCPLHNHHCSLHSKSHCHCLCCCSLLSNGNTSFQPTYPQVPQAPSPQQRELATASSQSNQTTHHLNQLLCHVIGVCHPVLMPTIKSAGLCKRHSDSRPQNVLTADCK